MTTPERGYISLTSLLESYAPPYRDSWDDWFNNLEGHTLTLVEDLASELATTGAFTDPVILCEGEWDEDEEGNREYFPPVVGDGMHRLAAHKRTGKEEVFVQYGYSHTSAEEDPFLVLTCIFLTQDLSQEEGDIFGDLMECLSFRVDEVWLTVSLAGQQEARGSVYFEGVEQGQVALPRLAEALQGRLEGWPLRLESLSWRKFPETLEEDDIILEEVHFSPEGVAS